MLDKEDLLKVLKYDIKDLEDKIDNPKKSRLKNSLVSFLLKMGIVVDYSLPFILVSFLIFNSFKSFGNLPFSKNKIKDFSNVEKISSSTGLEIEKKSYTKEYKNCLQHTTGWIINELGLYERIVTTYKIDDKIDLNNTSKILAMSKEEIEAAFTIINIEVIEKNSLNVDDELYTEDMLIVIAGYEDKNDYIYRDENNLENVIITILYLAFVMEFGYMISLVNRLFIKRNLRDKCKDLQEKFRPINKKELKELKMMLELKKENLELLSNDELKLIRTRGDSHERLF